MTTPLGSALAATLATATQQAADLDAAYAKSQASLASSQATNAQLLTVQAQNQATIGTQAQRITALEAQLAAQAPATVWGASVSQLDNESMAKAVARMEATMGPLGAVRVYDNGRGASWLLGQLQTNGLLDGKRKIVASIKVADAGTDALIAAVDYLTIWHEPDQRKSPAPAAYAPRIDPATHHAMMADLRSRIDKAGRTGKTKLMLILTGTDYANRLKSFWPGPNVVDVLGVDPYASKGTAAQLVQPLLDAAKPYGLPLAVTEIGMGSAASKVAVEAFVASLPDLAGKVELVTWFNQPGTANLGNRIDNDPAAAATFKNLTGKE